MNPDYRLCALIPVYNHEKKVGDVFHALMAHDLFCILVNDGSNQLCQNVLNDLVKSAQDKATLLSHEKNQGKGAACITGMRHAYAQGFSHVLQIDADGQHDTHDIAKLIALSQKNPQAVISAQPLYDRSAPTLRFYARYATHVWVWINTLSFAIKDSMCGFRIYPLTPVCRLLNQTPLPPRMAFDSEILVRLFWDNIAIFFVQSAVHYPKDGRSHFRALDDNIALTCMHTRLFFGMLKRLPRLILRKLTQTS
jgi:glycosyltransferase involved in cell wall biosynthesis